jgi:hypothetical protein
MGKGKNSGKKENTTIAEDGNPFDASIAEIEALHKQALSIQERVNERGTSSVEDLQALRNDIRILKDACNKAKGDIPFLGYDDPATKPLYKTINNVQEYLNHAHSTVTNTIEEKQKPHPAISYGLDLASSAMNLASSVSQGMYNAVVGSAQPAPKVPKKNTKQISLIVTAKDIEEMKKQTALEQARREEYERKYGPGSYDRGRIGDKDSRNTFKKK